MDVTTAKTIIANLGFSVIAENRLRNDTGTRLDVNNGAIINVYDKGTFDVQGKNIEILKSALKGSVPQESTVSSRKTINNQVFVVYGHDKIARTQLVVSPRNFVT